MNGTHGERHHSEQGNRTNGDQSEEQPTPEAGAKARHAIPAREVGREHGHSSQEATLQGRLAQATKQEGPRRQVAPDPLMLSPHHGKVTVGSLWHL